MMEPVPVPNNFLEGGAVDHFERRGSASWALVAILILAVALGVCWANATAVRAQQREREKAEEARARAEEARSAAQAKQLADQAKKVAPLPPRHFLEKGKSYSFYNAAQNHCQSGVVVEEPRDNWVKLRDGDNQDVWVNLGLVLKVLPALEAKGGKDADKGAVEGKGTVRGMVNVKGKPVEKGEVRFYSEQPVVIVVIKDGRFEVVLPPGVMRVTIKGDGVPEKYGDKDTTPLKVEVKQGPNQFDFDLPR
jgi:hypothetical protein